MSAPQPALRAVPRFRQQEKLAGLGEQIRDELRASVGGVIEAGRLLQEAKRLCRHGEWTEWLSDELGWNDRTAQDYIRVYEVFGASNSKTANVRGFQIDATALILLSRSKTPAEVREEALTRASREHVSHKDVKAMLRKAKPPVNLSQPLPPPRPKSAREQARTDFGYRISEWENGFCLRDLELMFKQVEIEKSNGYADGVDLLSKLFQSRLHAPELIRSLDTAVGRLGELQARVRELLGRIRKGEEGNGKVLSIAVR